MPKTNKYFFFFYVLDHVLLDLVVPYVNMHLINIQTYNVCIKYVQSK